MLTPKGFKDLFVLVFLHVGTRRVIVSPATYHPNGEWVAAQAATFVKQAKAARLRTEILYHDRDTKFTAGFDTVLTGAKIEVRLAPIRSPNMMAFVERFVQTIKQECLDHFFVFGQPHMDYLCREFVEHYHIERPHQGKGNKLLRRRRKPQRTAKEAEAISLREIHCKQRLGGLLKHYYRDAA